MFVAPASVVDVAVAEVVEKKLYYPCDYLVANSNRAQMNLIEGLNWMATLGVSVGTEVVVAISKVDSASAVVAAAVAAEVVVVGLSVVVWVAL